MMSRNQMAAETLVKQANVFHREGDYQSAITAYQEAIALMPTSPTFLAYHFMIGDMLFEMQRYQVIKFSFLKGCAPQTVQYQLT